jgi:hypothetical protein
MRRIFFVCILICLLLVLGVVVAATTTSPLWVILFPFAGSGVILSFTIYVVADKIWNHVQYGHHRGDQSWRFRPLG